MLFPPFIFVIFTIVALSLWFYRSSKADASLWMYATYAGAFGLVITHYASFTSFDEKLPLVIRDFLLIGVAGFLQSLAVAKRIKIWHAMAGIALVYGLVYLLPFEAEPTSADDSADPATLKSAQNTPIGTFSKPDPEGEYLIEKRENVTEAELQAWAEDNGYQSSKAFMMHDENATELDDFYVLNVPEAGAPTLALIEKSQMVDWVEDNETVAVDLNFANAKTTAVERPLTNDPEVDKQWAMNALEMQEYYDLLRQLKPAKKIKIAILDTGIDAGHEDIEDNYFSTQTKYDNDPRGHGTHCAGIAAGVTDNGVGIASPAGNNGLVEITSIKVLSAGGAGTQKTIIQGMLEAVDSGVDVISMSLGGYSNSSRQRAYNQAVSYARRNNVIVVAAAGNSNREATGFSPANAAGAICVSAIDELSLRAPFSNRVGKIKMAIAAPGVAIHSTFPNNRYKSQSGTSMACPFVAGLIAVLKSQQPELTTDEIYKILYQTGKVTSEEAQLGRIVQPAAALRAVID
ncbi:subtilisin [Lewinellaceae bacterium SD302]|nr:subtilisin [Lewinellaceae bacterium SD302]